jgi:hypothetical protein
LSRLDLVEKECPMDVVDRLLWRNAQRILDRHAARLDGSCQWCGRGSPCSPRRLAERADAVSRQPIAEGWAVRNEITRLLPVLAAQGWAQGERRQDASKGDHPRNRRGFS